MTTEWLRQGKTVYLLEHDGWHRGEERQRNRWSFHVQGYQDTPDEELEAIATMAQSAPDLLAALKECLLEHGGFTIKGRCERISRAAIAKAEGKS